jgi:S-DNA-T family DNA segregation ATPase FtsK/SpoIIIE
MAEVKDAPGVLGALAIMIGVGGEILTKNPLWNMLSLVGVVTVIWPLLPDPRKKIKRLFKALRLYYKEDDNEWFPEFKRVNELEYGKEYVLALPPGVCSEDFKKQEQRLSEGLKAHVETRYENGLLRMKVLKSRLLPKYDFEMVETQGAVEIPIGYGHEGLMTLVFNDQVSALLVGGYPGSGKSVFLRQAIVNLILTKSPADLNLHLVDLKNGVEFEMFRKVEHVAGFAKDETGALKLFNRLEQLTIERYHTLGKAGVVNVTEYNKRRTKMNHHLVVIDEYANLRENKEIQAKVDKLLRICRAVGIYFIICTQRPSAETVPGLIKANTQAVLAFAVKNQVNSRILLDNDKAADIEIPGRAIYQQGSKDKEVQVMLLPDSKARSLIKPFCRKSEPQARNSKGVELC